MPIRLLERIAYSEIPASSGRPSSYEGMLKLSILEYLDGLLNTRRGEVYIDKNYGLPNMANIASNFVSGSKVKIGDAIVEQILLYEKRIHNPRIREDDEIGSGIIRYILEGMVDVVEFSELLRNFAVEITVRSSGRITLKEKRGL
jgi:predicted component of type VI protein secretion system